MIEWIWQRPGGDEQGLHFEGPRIAMRPPRPGDYVYWAALRAASRRFLEPWEPSWPEGALSKSMYRQRLRRYALERRAGTGHAFFAFRRDDQALLGGVNLTNIQRGAAQSASIGYWIGEAYARQGYMTEAVICVVGFAFGQLQLQRLEAACLSDNAASRRLLERCGFRHEGEARKYLQINGVRRDHLIYALLREDWRAAGAPTPATLRETVA